MEHPLYGFVTGMGRSGTQSVARLLSLARLDAHHHYIGDRTFWLLSSNRGNEFARPYLRRSFEALRSNINGHQESYPSAFVDVNPYLQHCVPALREVVRPTEVFHLVRDPRRVIPSLMVRRDHNALNVIPRDEASIEWWLNASSFERVCWNWQNVTSMLFGQDTRLLKLEDLTTDFDFVRDGLVNVLGGTVSFDDWEQWRITRSNRTRSRSYRVAYSVYRRKTMTARPLKQYEDWSASEREQLEEICGNVMAKVGYA